MILLPLLWKQNRSSHRKELSVSASSEHSDCETYEKWQWFGNTDRIHSLLATIFFRTNSWKILGCRISLIGPNCFVVNLSSLVRRLKGVSFTERIELLHWTLAILTECDLMKAIWRPYTQYVWRKRGGASPTGSHRDCIESLVLWKQLI